MASSARGATLSPVGLSFLFRFRNWVAPPPDVFFHSCGNDLRSGYQQTPLKTLRV